MFCSFCTLPADTSPGRDPSNDPSSQGRFLTWFLLSVWGLLMVFGAVAATDPAWLESAAQYGIGNDARIMKEGADNLLHRGMYRKAVAAYDRTLAVRPDYPQAEVNQAVAYIQLKQYQPAARILVKVLKSGGASEGLIYFNIAECLNGLGRNEEAIEYYRRSLNTEVSADVVWQRLGTLYFDTKQLDSALAAFGNALTLLKDPVTQYTDMLRQALANSYDDSAGLAAISEQLDRPIGLEDLAAYDMEFISQCIAQDPEVAKTHNHIGYILATLGRYPEAREQFSQSLAIWPGNVDAVNNISLVNKLLAEESSNVTAK